LVTFWPADSRRRNASALCDVAGKFSLECLTGQYKITVTPSLQNAQAPGVENGASGATRPLPDQSPVIPGRYSATSTTPLFLTVLEGGESNLELTLTTR
jgi:hypothetical protein